MSTVPSKRHGRPPKSGDPATKDRLLEAAAEACVADGFESVTLADIAERAGVTATAIYNHFASREELLYAAGRRALDELAASLSPEEPDGTVSTPSGSGAVRDIAAAYLRPDMEPTRRLFLELHLAGARHPDLAAHLDDWHREFREDPRRPGAGRRRAPTATVKTLFMLLLGLCHLEDLAALPATSAATLARVGRLVDVLYPVATS